MLSAAGRWALPTTAAAGAIALAAAVVTWGPSTPGVSLPAVLGAGFIDGLNPCAIAVLLIFVSAMLAAVERATHGGDSGRRPLLVGGAAYIAGMYVTYFALGVGLLGTVAFLEQTHIVGRLVALLAIGLGLMSLQEALVPEWGERLVMPHALHGNARRLAQRVTAPALFVAGGAIGLCTVPCSGSIYLATVGLLSQQTTYLAGVAYLGLYNVMFVMPLAILLGLATARPTYRTLARVQLRARLPLKLLLGVGTVGIGLLTLAVM